MRTILAFVLTTAVLSAQPPRADNSAQIERIEKKIASGTATVPERAQLSNLYFSSGKIEKYRDQMAWIIENHPETPQARLNVIDAAGATLFATRWREIAANPDAKPLAIANAAWFFRFSDQMLAIALIEKASAASPHDAEILRQRGAIMISAIGGIMGDGATQSARDTEYRRSPAARRALAEIEASRDAPLLLGAAQTLLQQASLVADSPLFREDDPISAAERWALRAREIDTKDLQPSRLLSNIYDREAGQATDPKWKVDLLRKAEASDPNYFGLGGLAMAEFEAGDDEAAAATARRVLAQKSPAPLNSTRAHTVLGRLALARGDVETAKSELMASVAAIPTGSLTPVDRSLAQDLLDKGEKSIVIDFLERARASWPNPDGVLEHYIRVARSAGYPDITAPYRAGGGVRGRKVVLPGEFSGKDTAFFFRDADCKACDSVDASMKQMAAEHPAMILRTIDASEQNPLNAQLEVEVYPTVVMANKSGIVVGYLAGNIREPEMRTMVTGITATRLGLPAPKQIASDSAVTLAWSPVEGAESYVVQLDQRDGKGWISDRDDKLVRVIPSAETSVTLDPSNGETASTFIRWRVFAVTRVGPGAFSDWREVRLTP